MCISACMCVSPNVEIDECACMCVYVIHGFFCVNIIHGDSFMCIYVCVRAHICVFLGQIIAIIIRPTVVMYRSRFDV